MHRSATPRSMLADKPIAADMPPGLVDTARDATPSHYAAWLRGGSRARRAFRRAASNSCRRLSRHQVRRALTRLPRAAIFGARALSRSRSAPPAKPRTGCFFGGYRSTRRSIQPPFRRADVAHSHRSISHQQMKSRFCISAHFVPQRAPASLSARHAGQIPATRRSASACRASMSVDYRAADKTRAARARSARYAHARAHYQAIFSRPARRFSMAARVASTLLFPRGAPGDKLSADVVSDTRHVSGQSNIAAPMQQS